jgi:hypothetical protein
MTVAYSRVYITTTTWNRVELWRFSLQPPLSKSAWACTLYNVQALWLMVGCTFPTVCTLVLPSSNWECFLWTSVGVHWPISRLRAVHTVEYRPQVVYLTSSVNSYRPVALLQLIWLFPPLQGVDLPGHRHLHDEGAGGEWRGPPWPHSGTPPPRGNVYLLEKEYEKIVEKKAKCRLCSMLPNMCIMIAHNSTTGTSWSFVIGQSLSGNRFLWCNRLASLSCVLCSTKL